jgi:hypothetical protein
MDPLVPSASSPTFPLIVFSDVSSNISPETDEEALERRESENGTSNTSL